jgi:hypothetical protein
MFLISIFISVIFVSIFIFFLKRINFIKDFINFKKKMNDSRFIMNWSDKYPWLNDKTLSTPFNSHYIYHPAWAARIVKKINPKKHIDISSTLNFCAIVSAFVPIEFYDYRPAKLNLGNLKTFHCDLTKLKFKSNSIKSLSCMHTIEHIGLGRYGDPIDPNGDIKAINELKRVTAKSGNLLIVVPIGKSKIEFNAHRIYSYKQIISYFQEFNLENFSLVTDDPNFKFIEGASEKLANSQNYGCGCFYFKKN